MKKQGVFREQFIFILTNVRTLFEHFDGASSSKKGDRKVSEY